MLESISLPLQLTLLLAVGVFCQWLGWRLRLPAILFLLLAGILLGPVAGWLDPDAILKDLLFPFVSMGVAIILFEGSLTLRLSEVRGLTRFIRNLTSLGVLVTWLVLSLAAHHLAGMTLEVAFLFGALVSVTGPTVIVPMLRSLHTTARVANILRWEGIIVDPIGALLAVLVYEWIVSAGHGEDSVIAFVKLVGAGVVLGLAGAYVLRTVLKRHWIPEYLANFFSLALVLLVFTGANEFEHESGLVAVTVMGMALANMKAIDLESILDFKEHLTVLLVSLLFILLAARMDIALIHQVGWTALALLIVAQFVARPLSVLVSAVGAKMQWRELVLISWVAPRGIVAAAIASLFALRLTEQGVTGAELLLPFVFVLIIGTVVFQSATANAVARAVNLSLTNAQGVMIQGANMVSIAIAEALHQQGIDVLLVDDNRVYINEARMKSIRTYYGNILSDHADVHLDLTGMKYLLLMGRRSENHPLIYTQYRPAFGPQNIYALNASGDATASESKKLSAKLTARPLFDEQVSWSRLASLMSKGGELRFTRLSESFGLEEYQAIWGENMIPMFALSPDNKLLVYTAGANIPFTPGWQIGSLVVETDAVKQKLEHLAQLKAEEERKAKETATQEKNAAPE